MVFLKDFFFFLSFLPLLKPWTAQTSALSPLKSMPKLRVERRQNTDIGVNSRLETRFPQNEFWV